MRAHALICLLTLYAAAADGAEPFRIGVSGIRTGPEAEACRPYDLTFSQSHSNPLGDTARVTDLWWMLGPGEGNAVDAAFSNPVPVAEIALTFYGYVGSPRVCEGAIAVYTSTGRSLGTVQLGAQLCAANTAGNFSRTLTLNVPSTTVAGSPDPSPDTFDGLRLVDLTPELSEADGFLVLQRVELRTQPVSRPFISNLMVGPGTGFSPDGWAYSAPGDGYYILAEGQEPRPVALPPGEGLELSVAFAQRQEGTQAMMYFPEGMASDVSLLDKVFVLDLVTPGAEPRLLVQLPALVSYGWYDECVDALYAVLANGTAVRIGWDGSLTPTEVLPDE